MLNDQELLALARAAAARAYVPYSHFPVGAALECADGTVFTGCNVENAAYGDTICAERCAVVKAVSEGHVDFAHIAIWGNAQDYCWPCGTCRQVLSEFNKHITVTIGRGDGAFVTMPLTELLPHTFDF